MQISLAPSQTTGNRNPSGPVYAQIAEQIRTNIDSGRLTRGERLPPIRALAAQLGVNRDTVALAYETLARSGILESTVGRGTFVRATVDSRVADAPRPRLASSVERLLDFEAMRPNYVVPGEAAPLHSLTPDPSLYPLRAFRRSLNHALTESGTDLLIYGGHQGSDPLRAALSRHLAGHGIEATPDSLVLCQGASQGVSLALRLYTEPGDTVAVEDPTYHNVLNAITALGLHPVAVPMTNDGPDLEVLDRLLARAEVKLFYTMPSFHNPLGTTTSLAHRQALLDLATRHGKPIIEDGFELDLRFRGQPVAPLAALDRAALVVHLFSFSKSLFPGVRVGAITAQGRAVRGLLALKQATDLSGTLVLQAAVAHFVDSGGYARHLKAVRRALRARAIALLDGLRDEIPPGTRWTEPDGGYQVWVELPGGLDSRALLGEAQQAGVAFAPGYQFHFDGRPSPALRLTTALADPVSIRRGVKALATVTRRHLTRGNRATPRSDTIQV